MIRRVVSYFAPPGRKTGPGFLNLHYWSIYFIKTKLYMHTKIWWSYVHIRYLVHVQKWTYLALGWPYGWALNFKYILSSVFISAGHWCFAWTVFGNSLINVKSNHRKLIMIDQFPASPVPLKQRMIIWVTIQLHQMYHKPFFPDPIQIIIMCHSKYQ